MLLRSAGLLVLVTAAGFAGSALADDDVNSQKCQHIKDPIERAKCIVEAKTDPPPDPPPAAVTTDPVLGVPIIAGEGSLNSDKF